MDLYCATTMPAASDAGSSKPRLRTSFAKSESLDPFYSGGAVAVTADAGWLATSFGTDVHIVESATSRILHKITGDGEDINSLALTPNDTFLITASRSLSLHVYALADMERTRTISKAHEAPVALMAVDPTSSLLATGSADGSVKVWDLRGGYCTHVFRGHGGVVSALCWHVESRRAGSSARGVQLITGCVDGKVRVWDLRGGAKAASKPTAVLHAHAGVVRGIGISSDGKTIVSGARDQTLVFWDWKEGRWTRRDIQLIHERIEALKFLPGTPWFATAGSKGILRVWDVSSGSEVIRQESTRETDSGAGWGSATHRGDSAHGDGHEHGGGGKDDVDDDDDDDDDELRGLMDALVSSESHAIVTVSATQDLAFFALHASSDTEPQLVQTHQLVGYNDEIVDMTLLEQQKFLAVASNNSQLRIYKLDTHDHDVSLVDGHADMVLSLDASPDSKWLVSGSKDQTARIWARVDDGRDSWTCLGICEGHAESVGCVKFARKSLEMTPFVVTASQDRTLKLWDLSQLTDDNRFTKLSSLITLKIHEKDINAIDIAPNNGLLVSGSQDRTVKVFRLNYTAPGKHTKPSATLDTLATCRGHKRGVWSVQFSPAEQAFASASSDQTVRMWSLQDFACVRVFEGHTGSVLRLQYLPSGAQIVSSGNDGLVKVWNVRDEECAVTVDAHEDKIWTLAVREETASTPLQIISGAADSTITLWSDTTAAVEAEKMAVTKEAVEREQQFTNLVLLKDYRNAIALAFQLDQPRRLLQLFSQVATSRPDYDAMASMDRLLADALGTRHVRGAAHDEDEDEDARRGSITGLAAVDGILQTLPRSQLVQLLSYIRDWNTSSRTSPIAQLLLHAIVRQWDAEAILDAFEEARKQKDSHAGHAHGMSALSMLDGLMPYTERHYARVDRMLVESAMLDYTLQAMDSVLGVHGEEAMDDEGDMEEPSSRVLPMQQSVLTDTARMDDDTNDSDSDDVAMDESHV